MAVPRIQQDKALTATTLPSSPTVALELTAAEAEHRPEERVDSQVEEEVVVVASLAGLAEPVVPALFR